MAQMPRVGLPCLLASQLPHCSTSSYASVCHIMFILPSWYSYWQMIVFEVQCMCYFAKHRINCILNL